VVDLTFNLHISCGGRDDFATLNRSTWAAASHPDKASCFSAVECCVDQVPEGLVKTEF